VIERELTCQEFVELVTEYLDGAMPAEERARFEAHLADCPSCGSYLDQIRQTMRLLGRLSEETLPAEIKEEMLHRFRTWRREHP
jgi:mycothiol system anti-sigma-R factor